MRKVTFLLIAFILLSANVKKENERNEGEAKDKSTLEILVIDELTEDPIVAAKIKIDQNGQEAYTDFDGIAKIEDLAKGPYDIEISFISYKKRLLNAYEFNQSNRKLIVKLQP